MEYRTLGTSPLRVSAVGFGCWQIGGYYWGRVDEGEWIAAVHRALDLGITFFDTADFYGFGRAEELLAKALGRRRQEVVIATKVGLVSRGGRTDFGPTELLELEEHIEKDLTRAHITEAAEASLRRLGTDAIDLYLMHWPDPRTPLEETMEALAELMREGKVRAVGCCNFPPEQMAAATGLLGLHAHQLPLSVLDRRAEAELLPACRRHGISAIAYWALGKGLLSGKYGEQAQFAVDDWRHFDPLFQGEAYRRNLRTVAALRGLAVEEGITVGQLAIAWVLSRPGVATAIVGAKRPDQIEETAAAGGVTLGAETQKRIDAVLEQREAEL